MNITNKTNEYIAIGLTDPGQTLLFIAACIIAGFLIVLLIMAWRHRHPEPEQEQIKINETEEEKK